MARKTDRINLMKMIFQMEMQQDFSTEACEHYMENVLEGRPEDPYFLTLYGQIRDNLDTIDEKINAFSKNWKTSRMAKVDLAILRVSAAEILYMDDISPAVTANEAVEIAKKYSTEKSPGFINGVLGGIAGAHE
ncbi:MAG: transcription antitermination factor NusB [Firmicutes bacterium]|nr:transcription antitermination factor NusB [Bacillota bacterium]